MSKFLYVLNEQIELDEKYIQKSYKGLQIEGIKIRKRKELASKHGLSNKKVYIITAVQRYGKAIVETLNMAKLTS